MAPVFSKNAILIGMVDYYCLVCEAYLKSESETVAHIAKPVHQKILESVQYVPEFKEDRIIKIKNKYYCELCNKLLTVLARVRLHITDQMHNDSKKTILLQRVGRSIVAFENVVISNESWNGLNENSCAICNTEYENEEIHQNEPTHVLNVMQMQVEFDENKNIYRKIDEVSFNCLTCNLVLGLNTVVSHFNENDHRKQYQACCDAYSTLNSKAEKKVEVKHSRTAKNEITKSITITKIATSEPKKNGVNDNEKVKTVEVIKQESSINASKEKENETSQYIHDENHVDRICKELNCKNYITHDENKNTWCILCDWVMAPNDITNHLNGKHHKTMLKMHNERNKKISNNCINSNDEGFTQKDSSAILDKLIEFQNNHININFESNTAVCKKCKKDVQFDHKAIERHTLEHTTKPVKEEIKSILIDAGQANTVSDKGTTILSSPVVLKPNNVGKKQKSEISCNNVEESKLGDSSKTAKDYVQKQTKSDGVPTTTCKVKKPKPLNLNKVPMKHFIESIIAVDNAMMFKDLIINNKYCINFFSLHWLINILGNVWRCEKCEVDLQGGELQSHLSSDEHIMVFDEMPMIINDESEFIRELRPGQFHCGFCNCIQTSWEVMEQHLKCSIHKECKNSASWRICQYRHITETQNYERLMYDHILMNAIVDKYL